MDKQQLKPCPFCGHDTPEFERLGTPGQSCIVVCGNCGCQHESSDEGEHNGMSWNSRSEPMLDEYLRWLDFYHAGNGNFDDFLKQELPHG